MRLSCRVKAALRAQLIAESIQNLEGEKYSALSLELKNIKRSAAKKVTCVWWWRAAKLRYSPDAFVACVVSEDVIVWETKREGERQRQKGGQYGGRAKQPFLRWGAASDCERAKHSSPDQSGSEAEDTSSSKGAGA